ncbi:hypothetical protein Tco_0510237, partial [Tanacetum coccineum]
KKKFKMLAHDKEIARKMQEEWEVEEEKNRLAAEEAINDAFIQEFNDVKARIEADRLLLREGFLQNKDLLQSETNHLPKLN